MRLAPQSIPYRALQKVSGFVVVGFFVVNSNGWGLPLAVGVAGAMLLAAFGYETAYYRRFDYEFAADTFDIASGVISRREREIPYRRIQNVDVSQSVIQRAIGIAAVDLETAGGSSTEGSIRFVSPAEATRIRREVQRRKSGAGGESGTGGDADDPATAGVSGGAADAETELFAISPKELALVGALSFDGRLIGLLAFLGSGSFPVLSGFLPGADAAALTATAFVAVGGLFLVSWVLGAGVAFSNYYGFRLARAGDELRYERGLFRRYSGSIPTEKVQTLTITDNPAKRALGYASLAIETAGYAPGQNGDQGSQSAVPIAAAARVYGLAREVEPFGDPRFDRPPKRIRWRYAFRYTLGVAVLTGIAFATDWYLVADLPWFGLLVLLPAVPPAAHLKWKHRGYWLGEDHLLTRNGFWSRTVTVVPYYRVQNVIDSRTVFQRRWGVATIVADTAGSSSLTGNEAAAVDIAVDEAVALRETLRERLHEAVSARRRQRSGFEWIEGDPGDDPPDEGGGTPGDGDEVPGDGDEVPEDDTTESARSDTATAADAATVEADAEEPPDDGVIRPDFAGSDRDYSEPAKRVDTGNYAVDRFPSDADVTHRDENDDDSDADGDAADTDGVSDDSDGNHDSDSDDSDDSDDHGRRTEDRQ
ncbi:PH domain-containing protein [Halorubrum sp. BV1]|uniref:PH domain-containing protein n=1 Tax=Halorubrum sp. BV1 TaxID=1498500 RepID=UPI000678A95B|nr:PH domain-containing protein [Halorubrum sp. BV1]